jgi:hypothetical protein
MHTAWSKRRLIIPRFMSIRFANAKTVGYEPTVFLFYKQFYKQKNDMNTIYDVYYADIKKKLTKSK